MTAFLAIYQFTCPGCNKINSRARLYDCADASEPCRRIVAIKQACEFCVPLNESTQRLKIIVWPATDEDLRNYSLESAP